MALFIYLFLLGVLLLGGNADQSYIFRGNSWSDPSSWTPILESSVDTRGACALLCIKRGECHTFLVNANLICQLYSKTAAASDVIGIQAGKSKIFSENQVLLNQAISTGPALTSINQESTTEYHSDASTNKFTTTSAPVIEEKLIFYSTSGHQGALYDYWTGSTVDDCVLPVATMCKSPDVENNWDLLQTIRLEIRKSGSLGAYVTFDAAGSDKMSWFSRERIINSSYTDLKTAPNNYFSITGHDSEGRRFFICSSYNACPTDMIWMVMKDEASGTCVLESLIPFRGDWDYHPTLGPTGMPIFRYCPGTTKCLARSETVLGDEMLIFATKIIG